MNKPIQLVVGLGNPGAEYAATRHNVGFMVIDVLRARMHSEPMVHVAESYVWSCRFRGRKVWLQEPMTFMNLSGRAVSKFCRKEMIEVDSILIVYDDVSLPLGRIRMRQRGSSGGHNGMESAIECLETTQINRLRVGIGDTEKQGGLVDHVLSRFAADEQSLLEQTIKMAADAVLQSLVRGMTVAMDQFNGLDLKVENGNEETGSNEH